jgi:hypothetical protein
MNHTKFCVSNKMRNCLRTFSVLFLALAISINTMAQQDSTNIKREKQLKNIAKLNISSWVLYSNGFQLAYERLLSSHTSITLFGGYIEFPMPSIIANSALNFDKDKTKSGYSFGSEFRFYLSKENKYDAPHGVYLAPFISFYHFNNQRNGHDSTNQDQLTLNTTMDFLNIGGELGYQFVIKKRFTVDCVLFGPAITSYYFSLQLNGSTSGDHSQEVQDILDAIKQKYPLIKDLTSGEKLSSSGVSNFWSLGFRYVVQIGYRF